MKKNNSQGFTLIETVIYVALMGMIIGTLSSFVISVSALKNKQHVLVDVRSNERVLSELIRYLVRTSVSVSMPVRQASSSVLVLQRKNVSGVSRIYEDNGTVYLDEAGKVSALTGNDCRIANLNVINLAPEDSPDNIRFSGHISGSSNFSPEYSYDDDFMINTEIPF